MIFGFGPAMLVERGWTLTAASSSTSLVLWLVALSVPLGGFLSDRLGRRDLIMVLGFVAFAALLCLAPGTGSVFLIFGLLGLVGGLPAGPIMSLPAAVLSPGNRALGMGVFFALFYLGVVAAPIAAGALSEGVGTSTAAFYMGAGLLAICVALLGLFRRLETSIG